jgi:hypothetical protein
VLHDMMPPTRQIPFGCNQHATQSYYGAPLDSFTSAAISAFYVCDLTFLPKNCIQNPIRASSLLKPPSDGDSASINSTNVKSRLPRRLEPTSSLALNPGQCELVVSMIEIQSANITTLKDGFSILTPAGGKLLDVLSRWCQRNHSKLIDLLVNYQQSTHHLNSEIKTRYYSQF